MNHTLKRSKYASFAIAVLGIVSCFPFVESARGQNLAVWKGALGFDDAARTVTRESNRYVRYAVTAFVARLSGSDDYYPQKISTLGALMTPVVETLDKSDLAPDEKERRRASVLKQAREMREAIRETILFESPDRDEDVDRGAEILRSVLTRVGAQDELDAFERELQQWRDDAKNDALQNVLKDLPVDSEAGETPTEPMALIEIFHKLIDEERAKSEPDQDLLDLMEFRLFVVVKRLTWDRPEEAEQILRDAIERENEADPPNQEFLNSYSRELEQQEYRRLIHNKDADGVLALWRQALERRLEDPKDNAARSRIRKTLEVLKQIDREKTNDAVYETLERHLSSVLLNDCQYLVGLQEYEGTRVKFEGIRVDGTPFDWNDYAGKPGVIVFFRSIDLQNYHQLFSLLQKYARCEGANVAGYIVDGNPKYIGNIPEIAGLNVVSRIMTLEAKEADYLDVGLYYGYGVDVPHSQIAQSSTPMVVIYDEQGKIVQYQEAQLFPVETFLCQQSPEIVRKEDERIRELLDFPEGKNAAFYLEKYQALTGETVRYYGHVIPVYAEQFVKRFNDGNPYFAERFKNLEQKITEAIQKTVKLLAQTPEDDDSVAPSQKREFYDSYVENLKLEKDRAAMTELLDFERTQGEFGRERVYALERDLADLDFELARETDHKNALENLQKLLDDESKSDNPHVDNMRYFTRRVLEIKIENAIGEDDESALKEALDECVEAETVEDEDLQKRPEFLYIKDIMNALKGGYNRPDDAEYLRKSALNKFKSSETPRAKQLASELAAVDRRDSLKGKTLIFRGSYYNPDDSSDSPTFDWNGARYRGRPVLIFCYGLDDIDAGLEDIRGIYRKFYVHNNAGLVVLGYYDGSTNVYDPPGRSRYVPRTFAEEYKKRNIPWQTVWSKRGEQNAIHYESLVKYYDLPTPSAILVDADGKVIDVFKIGAFSGRLYEELRKLFPNVQ